MASQRTGRKQPSGGVLVGSLLRSWSPPLAPPWAPTLAPPATAAAEWDRSLIQWGTRADAEAVGEAVGKAVEEAVGEAGGRRDGSGAALEAPFRRVARWVSEGGSVALGDALGLAPSGWTLDECPSEEVPTLRLFRVTP
jgi:hypothetical protein